MLARVPVSVGRVGFGNGRVSETFKIPDILVVYTGSRPNGLLFVNHTLQIEKI